MTRTTGDTGRISLDDIESQLRSLGGSAQAVVAESKTTATAAAVVGAVVTVASVYFLGRRRGRRRSTELEIRRV
jgi:membrane protein DedA with SNARE-associated domain